MSSAQGFDHYRPVTSSSQQGAEQPQGRARVRSLSPNVVLSTAELIRTGSRRPAARAAGPASAPGSALGRPAQRTPGQTYSESADCYGIASAGYIDRCCYSSDWGDTTPRALNHRRVIQGRSLAGRC